MEVKIGVQHAPRELVVDSADSAEAIQAALDAALSGDGTLALSNIAYVEIGGGVSGQVGFRG
jgi:hypothetical protein